MTDAQFKVLSMLEKFPRETSRTTHHGVVSGVVAMALSKRGLVRRSMGRTTMEITSKGMLALMDEREYRKGLETVRAALQRSKS